MIERGLGWCEDASAIVDAQIVSCAFENLVGGGPISTPTRIDYTGLLDVVPDQRNTSSCVGQAFATALYLTAKLAGIPIPRPSAKAIYDFARAEDQPYVRLTDLGCRPLAAIACLSDKGMVADADWPLVFQPDGMSNVNVRAPLDIYQGALGFKLGDYYRIPAGPGAAAAVRLAISRGYCPAFAMPVDDAFQRWNSSRVYDGRRGPSLGGHMQVFAGFDTGYLKVLGSWGTLFADHGVINISDDYVDSGECRDIIVPTLVPFLATT